MALALAMVAMAAVAGAALRERIGVARRAAPLPRLGPAPAFTLRNRDGATVSTRDLEGRPWIADFVFTRCALSCPLMSARMARLDRELPGAAAVRLVSFSVDPDHDTPAVLARYAASFAASPRWLFLTGDRAEIHRISRQGFRLGIAFGGPAAEPIAHSTRFVLVDRHGWIRRYYDVLDPRALPRLQDDVAAVAEEP